MRKTGKIMAKLETGFVESNGTKLYYETMGEGHPPLVPSPAYPSARQRVREQLSEYSFVWVLDRVEQQELTPPAYGRLAEISVPTLVIVGAEDDAQLHKSADKLEQDIVGVQRVSISETHHMPNMEKPEEFNRVVLTFLDPLSHHNQ